MPLGGERLRDVVNGDRDNVLGRYGDFELRQVKQDDTWLPSVSSGAFLHGFGSNSGVSRQARAALFDRTPRLRGMELVEHFIDDVARYSESGNMLAATLQRVYQRSVLTGTAAAVLLPDDPPPEESPVEEYPWRQ
jgi:hypothetical protein